MHQVMCSCRSGVFLVCLVREVNSLPACGIKLFPILVVWARCLPCPLDQTVCYRTAEGCLFCSIWTCSCSVEFLHSWQLDSSDLMKLSNRVRIRFVETNDHKLSFAL